MLEKIERALLDDADGILALHVNWSRDIDEDAVACQLRALALFLKYPDGDCPPAQRAGWRFGRELFRLAELAQIVDERLISAASQVAEARELRAQMGYLTAASAVNRLLLSAIAVFGGGWCLWIVCTAGPLLHRLVALVAAAVLFRCWGDGVVIASRWWVQRAERKDM